MATVVLVFAGLGLAFTVPLALALVTLFRGGAADWDPRREKLVSELIVKWMPMFSRQSLAD